MAADFGSQLQSFAVHSRAAHGIHIRPGGFVTTTLPLMQFPSTIPQIGAVERELPFSKKTLPSQVMTPCSGSDPHGSPTCTEP